MYHLLPDALDLDPPGATDASNDAFRDARNDTRRWHAVPAGATRASTAELAADLAPDLEWASRQSRYGYGVDVRATYAGLPCQPFWSWLTGKWPVQEAPRHPSETLLTRTQLASQLLWSWSLIALSLIAGHALLNNDTLGPVSTVAGLALVWLIVTNRTRGLLHTFHYTNHGASVTDKRFARFTAKWFMSIPILHLPWDNYHRIHARDHHGAVSLCTADDPDEQFMTAHGFRPGMPEREFWMKLVFAPFHPRAIYNHIAFRFRQNFIDTTAEERYARLAFWSVLLVAVVASGLTTSFVVLYLIPLLLITQYSSWIQHVTEHLWFAERPDGMSRSVYYAGLTWGRFLGRPYPLDDASTRRLLARRTRWWLAVVLVDLPIKLFSFMQDLPSHDYHHRSPKVNFWSISRERAAAEGRPSRFGPMAETWGLLDSFLIVRDQICYGKSDPFGLIEWDRCRRAAIAEG